MAETYTTPTDHGYAVVFRDGAALNVAVVADLAGGIEGAYAVHYGVKRLAMDAGVRLVDADGLRRTERAVAVTGGADGVVRLRARPAAVLAPRQG